MALSDCEKCWDTPCECGNYGYMVIRTKPENYKRLQDLPREEFDKLRAFLGHILNAALNPSALPTSGEALPNVDLDPQVVPLGKAGSVCKTCNDTHQYEIQGGWLAGRIMCGQCPIPCDMCRANGTGAYCEITPCPCSCHHPKVG